MSVPCCPVCVETAIKYMNTWVSLMRKTKTLMSLWPNSGNILRQYIIRKENVVIHSDHKSLMNIFKNDVSDHGRLDCLFRRRSTKTSELCVTGLCDGNSSVTGEFPAQMASNGFHLMTSSWFMVNDNKTESLIVGRKHFVMLVRTRSNLSSHFETWWDCFTPT